MATGENHWTRRAARRRAARHRAARRRAARRHTLEHKFRKSFAIRQSLTQQENLSSHIPEMAPGEWGWALRARVLFRSPRSPGSPLSAASSLSSLGCNQVQPITVLCKATKRLPISAQDHFPAPSSLLMSISLLHVFALLPPSSFSECTRARCFGNGQPSTDSLDVY